MDGGGVSLALVASFSEFLDDFKVGVHSFVAGIVVAAELTGDEFRVTICTNPFCVDRLGVS